MADLSLLVDEMQATGNNINGITLELTGVDLYDIPNQLEDHEIEEFLNNVDFEFLEDYVKRNKVPQNDEDD